MISLQNLGWTEQFVSEESNKMETYSTLKEHSCVASLNLYFVFNL